MHCVEFTLHLHSSTNYHREQQLTRDFLPQPSILNLSQRHQYNGDATWRVRPEGEHGQVERQYKKYVHNNFTGRILKMQEASRRLQKEAMLPNR